MGGGTCEVCRRRHVRCEVCRNKLKVFRRTGVVANAVAKLLPLGLGPSLCVLRGGLSGCVGLLTCR